MNAVLTIHESIQLPQRLMKANAPLAVGSWAILTVGCAAQEPDYDRYHRILDPPWWQGTDWNTPARPAITVSAMTGVSIVYSEQRAGADGPLSPRPNITQQRSAAASNLILQPR
jgi:hypothetical protein